SRRSATGDRAAPLGAPRRLALPAARLPDPRHERLGRRLRARPRRPPRPDARVLRGEVAAGGGLRAGGRDGRRREGAPRPAGGRGVAARAPGAAVAPRPLRRRRRAGRPAAAGVAGVLTGYTAAGWSRRPTPNRASSPTPPTRRPPPSGSSCWPKS